MPTDRAPGLELTLPYMQRKEVASNARYRWKCWDRGKNPFVILQWTLAGEGVFTRGQESIRVPADHAFIAVVPEHSTYHYPPEARVPWVFSWFNFYGDLACHLFGKLQSEFGPVLPLASRGAAAASLRRLLARGARNDASARLQVSLHVYAFILEWRREASQPMDNPENRLASALRFSREHFREPLGVKELAHEAGLSREHFSRIFTEHTGETPSAYLRRLRTKEAAILIRETDLPLREVAMRSGFYSERHLMRTFQRTRGLNPSQFRGRKLPLSRR